MAERAYRLGHAVGASWLPYRHAQTFERGEHVLAGVPDSDPAVFEAMLDLLQEPVRLLYVLHTPRGEAAPGRYESPDMSLQQAKQFVAAFAPLLASDGRFDLWAWSAADRATLVWDRHDQLFLYGPVERFVSRLEEMGYHQGPVRVPSPHEHHYRSEMDGLATELMGACAWRHSPLRPGDEQ